ncbi:hypothetical protein ATANTOWER_019160 [Ataeniobius toweri]|uniref:Uncharacterized protein n=1 Tax=Ataeniobius toweri TaxID=208326 RepID=A0ABU7BJK0_9TELE|nr:hypothetical protein [Ataeniobius toweri]
MNSDPNPMRPHPNQPRLEIPHSATPNQDTDYVHMPPNPNAMNPLPTVHGHTPTGELHPRKDDEATPTQRKPHTQPRSKHPRRVPHSARNHTDTPHHCHWNDSAGRNITQLSSTIAAQPI